MSPWAQVSLTAWTWPFSSRAMAMTCPFNLSGGDTHLGQLVEPADADKPRVGQLLHGGVLKPSCGALDASRKLGVDGRHEVLLHLRHADPLHDAGEEAAHHEPACGGLVDPPRAAGRTAARRRSGPSPRRGPRRSNTMEVEAAGQHPYCFGAGHASATGRFDDEQLFYLQSRGVDEAHRTPARGARLLRRARAADRRAGGGRSTSMAAIDARAEGTRGAA